MSGKIIWDRLRLFIFDLDGTLYDQQSLRRFMLRVLLRYYLIRPGRIGDLKIIREFRRVVEEMRYSGNPDPARQVFIQTAVKTGAEPSRVEKIIDQWMFRYPLPYLRRFKYKDAGELFDLLHQKNKKIAVYSDYPVREKLEALQLTADAMLHSLDPDINQLKPGSKGLESLMKKFGVQPEQCIFVGDRSDTDGKAAEQAGMSFLQFRKAAQQPNVFNMIYNQLLA